MACQLPLRSATPGASLPAALCRKVPRRWDRSLGPSPHTPAAALGYSAAGAPAPTGRSALVCSFGILPKTRGLNDGVFAASGAHPRHRRPCPAARHRAPARRTEEGGLAPSRGPRCRRASPRVRRHACAAHAGDCRPAWQAAAACNHGTAACRQQTTRSCCSSPARNRGTDADACCCDQAPRSPWASSRSAA